MKVFIKLPLKTTSIELPLINRSRVTFIVGIVIRLLLMVYTSHTRIWEQVQLIDTAYVSDLNPMMRTRSIGTCFYLFYAPSYGIFRFLEGLNIQYRYVLVFLFKVPALVGDLIIYYSLYTLGYRLLKDKKKSLLVAGAFFLNPFVIYSSAVTGGFELLMVSFILLAMSNIASKTSLSAVYSGIGSFFRGLFLGLLFPMFLCSLWPRRKTILTFILVFVLSSLALATPYLIFLIPLYLNSSWSSFLTYTLGFFALGPAPATTFPVKSLYIYRFSPAPFFLKLNLWGVLAPVFQMRVFFLLYAFLVGLAVFWAWKRARTPPSDDNERIKTTNLFIVLVLGFFLLLSPKIEKGFFAWLIPFLYVESHILRSIPKYYLHGLWMSIFLTSPIIDVEIVKWLSEVVDFKTVVDLRARLLKLLGGSGDYFGMGWNLPLQLSVGMLFWVFMLLTVAMLIQVRLIGKTYALQDRPSGEMTVVEKILTVFLAGLLLAQIFAEGVPAHQMLLRNLSFILLLITLVLISIQLHRHFHELRTLISSLKHLLAVFFYTIVQCLLGGTLMLIGIRTAWVLFLSIPAFIFLSFSNCRFSLGFQRIFFILSSSYLGLLVFLTVPYEISLICLLSLMLGLLSQHQLDISRNKF